MKCAHVLRLGAPSHPSHFTFCGQPALYIILGMSLCESHAREVLKGITADAKGSAIPGLRRTNDAQHHETLSDTQED